MKPELISAVKPAEKRLAELLPADIAKREISFALQLIAASPQLQQCTPLSLQSAVINVANIGLTLNPAAKEAYLVPRWNSKANASEATFQPSYIGLVKLLTDAGAVKSINCQAVYENDRLEMDMASGNVVHNPALVKSKRGDFIGCYAIATLPDGRKQIEWMDVEEINEVRASSESWKNEKTRDFSPWERHYTEMARKTVVRRAYKYLPRTRQMERIDDAIQADDRQYKATFNQVMYIDDLLRTANLPEQKIQAIERGMDGYSFQEAGEAIEFLLANQQEPTDPARQFTERSK